jgi:competence protein ComEC
VQAADGRYVTIARRADAFADDCEKAKLIVTARQPPPGCKATVFSEQRLRETGSVALYARSGGFAVEAVTPAGTSRPWARNSAPADDAAAAPRPADATPSVDGLSPDDQ